jgi:small ligand-binding sensory domain FIST
MTRLAIAFGAALDAGLAANILAAEVEATLGGPAAVAGAFVLSTAAAGPVAEAVGRRLLARWSGAELVGTSFEGIVCDGRVWQDEPALAVLAWGDGEDAPIPIVCEAGARDPDDLAKEILAAARGGPPGDGDVVILFPDALGTPSLPSLLVHFGPNAKGPWLAGAAAIGVDGGPAHAWALPEPPTPGDLLVGLRFPGGFDGGGPVSRVECAGATRLASPWLEITACRPHWIDSLEGEPPVDWIRRQLGLSDEAAVEPHLDRLLVRIARGPAPAVTRGGAPEEEPLAYEEWYLTGLDRRRGSIGLPGSFTRFDRAALALPDASGARETLRSAVDALPRSSLLLQFGCLGRGESLHGDRDLESAIVAHQSAGRRTLGVIAPFQLGTDPARAGRLLVHATVLAAVGPLDQSADSH